MVNSTLGAAPYINPNTIIEIRDLITRDLKIGREIVNSIYCDVASRNNFT